MEHGKATSLEFEKGSWLEELEDGSVAFFEGARRIQDEKWWAGVLVGKRQGLKVYEGTLENGERHGPWNEWNDTGSLILRSTYSFGLLDGAYRALGDDGVVIAEGEMRDGVKEGEWTVHVPTGKGSYDILVWTGSDYEWTRDYPGILYATVLEEWENGRLRSNKLLKHRPPLTTLEGDPVLAIVSDDEERRAWGVLPYVSEDLERGIARLIEAFRKSGMPYVAEEAEKHSSPVDQLADISVYCQYAFGADLWQYIDNVQLIIDDPEKYDTFLREYVYGIQDPEKMRLMRYALEIPRRLREAEEAKESR